jgi:isopentenyl diphosphate isomerase/L-lactate dehydrogenase-like FMN-dependent dehydrogenase
VARRLSGGRAARAGTIDELRAAAQRRMPRVVFDYLEGAAEDELTAGRNISELRAMELKPRVLVDVSHIETSTSVLGRPVSLPLLGAPMGLTGLLHPGGEVALDVPCSGNRDRDRRNGFSVAPRVTWRAVAGGLAHPRWSWGFVRSPRMGWGNLPGDHGRAATALSAHTNRQFNPAANWDDLDWFRQRWSGPAGDQGHPAPRRWPPGGAHWRSGDRRLESRRAPA